VILGSFPIKYLHRHHPGFPPFTFGSVELLNGVDFIPAIIELFIVSELIRSIMEGKLP
jgi:TctA family transporter